MPVSGQEETGVKSFAGQFSGLIAGVPIKKRRFPLIRASSPLSEEPCSVIQETELLQKENSSTSQVSNQSNASIAGAPIKKRRFPFLQASLSFLEEASPPEEGDSLRKEYSSTLKGSAISTSSSGLSDTNGNPVFEEGKAGPDATNANTVQSNSYYFRPKLEEHSCTSDVLDSKENVILNEGRGSPELLLDAKEGLAPSRGAEVSEQNVQDKCKPEEPVVPENTDLSLGLKDNLLQAVSSQEIDESCMQMVETEPVSLKLSLSKEERCDTSHVHSNRANWDLNITMDAWEESGTDAGSVKTSIDGLRLTGSADEKISTCATGMVLPTGGSSVKQTCEESQDKACMISSQLDSSKYNCVNPRDLCLAPCVQNYAEEQSRLSDKLNTGNAIPTVSLSSTVASAGDVNTASFRMVKSEPFDENLKRDLKEVNAIPVGSLDSVSVKQEFVMHSKVESFKSSNDSSVELVDPRLIKPEPGHDGNQERPKTAESITDQSLVELPHGPNNSSSAMANAVSLETMPVSTETVCPPVKPICSAELTSSESIVSQLENCTRKEGAHVEKVSHGTCSSADQVPQEIVARPIVDNGTELSGSGMKDSSMRSKQENADDHERCRLKLMNERPPDSLDSGEGCASDEEKITLSADMLEDDSYSSDYESDENHAVTVPVDTERYVPQDDDYEDGEVREPLEHHSTAEDVICEVREVEHPDCSSYEQKQIEKGVVIGDCPTSSHVEENHNKAVVHSEINSGEDVVDIEIHGRSGKVIDKNVCPQESLDAEKSTIASDVIRPVMVVQRKSLDLSERKNVSKALETELSSEQAANGGYGVDIIQCANEVVKTTDTASKVDSELPKMEASANTDDATKDVSSGGNQGRIINLSRAASGSSPSRRTRSISGRSLPSRVGRDVLSDALDVDKLHRGRDEVYIDGPYKFSRERHQDISPRNSRLNFGRGRGRVNSRLDTFRGEWESDREFSGEFYSSPSQFCGPRPKYASAIGDAELEYNNVAPDGSYVGNSRVGRKPLNDGSYIASRRSPGGRDAIQMGHRIPRAMSPSRCIGDDGSELVGMRHSEKFMRGFPEDNLDSMYTRPQPFEGLDRGFTRGRRNFSSIQRRGLPRIQSKSPIRSRSRSPGPWSSPRRRSPRRRSPDEFGGHPELTHRRSPLYRVDRMRSLDRPVFPGERVVRRHGSPSYMSRPSNDIRDIDPARDHGPRSVISTRSPSGRILFRNRRFDVADPRGRADNDDYFGGPMHTGRLLELSGEGNGEERRRFGERRGPVRSFRPSYNGNVGENFHLNAEEGPPRHYRFCPDDSDFHERGSLRERGFDRRIKGRPANVPPRRTRNIDEQEENYRHGGQVWSDDSFDDISRVKRKRF